MNDLDQFIAALKQMEESKKVQSVSDVRRSAGLPLAWYRHNANAVKPLYDQAVANTKSQPKLTKKARKSYVDRFNDAFNASLQKMIESGEEWPIQKVCTDAGIDQEWVTICADYAQPRYQKALAKIAKQYIKKPSAQELRQQRVKQLILGFVRQSPGIKLDNLAVKCGITPFVGRVEADSYYKLRHTERFKSFSQVVSQVAELRYPRFATHSDLPYVYPVGYVEPAKPKPIYRPTPIRVYRRGDPDYDRIWNETMYRKNKELNCG